MCGLAGIVTASSSKPEDHQIRMMTELASHRGPDGEGIFTWENVSLGHRRLSIVELTDLGSQPMHFDDLTIVFNGEIYNHKEIREHLESKGHKFHSHSDTEVILHAWKEWNTDCHQYFNGMWAFAILDKRQNKLFLSRDRFGVKPLYFYHNDIFYFASEIKQILPFVPNIKAQKTVCNEYIQKGLVDHTNGTFFDGIFKLEPGHYLEFSLNDNSRKIHNYYQLIPRIHKDLEETLKDAVSLRLRSDVPVGTCLSGGIDSSLIASMASRILHNLNEIQFNAIHACSTEKEFDESDFAKQVADAEKINLKTIRPGINDYIRNLDRVISVQEEPFNSPSVIMQYFVMEEAKNQKLKVMLDGQAADEILLGYKSYPGKIGAILFFSGKLNSLRKLLVCNAKPILKNILKGTSAKSVIDFQIQEIYSTHLQALLRYEDRNSMIHSVEARLPFMDYRVVETCLALSLDQKIHGYWQKFALRKIAEKYIPSTVAWRRDKIGFVSPLDTIVKGLKTQMLEEINSSKLASSFIKKEITDNNLLWRAYCLARWDKIFISK